MAQLSSCHSWDSLDSEKPCFFIYSIYWYKDSSLRDTSKCDIWSQVALMWNFKQAWKQRPHDVYGSSFVSSWGYYCTRPALKFQRRDRSHARTLRRATVHTSGCRSTDPWQVKISCVLPTWRPCELLNWAGPLDPHFGLHTENLLPVKHFATHTYMSTSLLLVFWFHVAATRADGTLCGAP